MIWIKFLSNYRIAYFKFTEFLDWDDETLESRHNFIQWLFPLPEKSPINSLSPILNANTVFYFRSSEKAQENLKMALDRMTQFLGFRSFNLLGKVIFYPSNWIKIKEWTQSYNHNQLRITRMIRCLYLVGWKWEARMLYLVCWLCAKLSKTFPSLLLKYWKAASKGKLYDKFAD